MLNHWLDRENIVFYFLCDTYTISREKINIKKNYIFMVQPLLEHVVECENGINLKMTYWWRKRVESARAGLRRPF